jgi:hypothetical protein
LGFGLVDTHILTINLFIHIHQPQLGNKQLALVHPQGKKYENSTAPSKPNIHPQPTPSPKTKHQTQPQGQFQDAFRAQCPETARLLHELHRQSALMAGTPFSFAFFSTLHPGAEIAAHTAPSNLRIRCHLPLIVPPFPPKDEPDPHAEQRGGGDYETMDDAKAAVPCGMRIGDQIRCVCLCV